MLSSLRLQRSGLAMVRAAGAVAAVGAIAVAMSLSGTTQRYAADVAVVGTGGVLCWFAVGALSNSFARPRRTTLDTLREERTREPGRVAELDEIEWALLDVKWERPGALGALAALLAPIVRARLIERCHTDPDVDRVAASRILGADAWSLVYEDATARPGADPTVTKARVLRLIEVLEEL